MSFLTEGVIQKCKEEIEWAESCLADTQTEYTASDKIFLTCWVKAHQYIIAEQSHEPELNRLREKSE